MLCPSCKSTHLVSEILDENILGHRCPDCLGQLLALSTQVGESPAGQRITPPVPETAQEDSKRAVCCPHCQRIMVKFKVTADAAHSLDYCFHCAVVWFDGGEWSYLKSAGLHNQLRVIASDAYQHRLRDEMRSRRYTEAFRESIGPDAFSTVDVFSRWLQNHPKRREILLYLNQHQVQ